MVGLRNITIHQYFGIDERVIMKSLPETLSNIKKKAVNTLGAIQKPESTTSP
jgi:uncharacterized protein YutE (UPF0331/DUF86 family)